MLSNIFDINTLLSENTLADELLCKPYSKESYMSCSIDSLSRFNESVLDINKELYKSLNEASSKAEENAIFGQFYQKYSNTLSNYINEVNVMIGRFSITVDNLVDANSSLVKDQDVLSCTNEFTYEAKRYKNLCGGKHPKFNALQVYQQEFDYIGQMMQDLGPVATDIAKLEVLASVCNSFCNKMKNKWLEKCIEEITGEDDCEDLSCYAKVLNGIFVDKTEEITVNRGTIYAMKEELVGYNKYKDAVISIGNKLISDFTYMSNDLGKMFFRNKDNILPIRSNKPDVESRDYQLNTYGMNQLDIFMKSKANQISQLCSLYVIALSVMMDSIINHLTQCADILERVKDQCDDSQVSSDDGMEPDMGEEPEGLDDEDEGEGEMKEPDLEQEPESEEDEDPLFDGDEEYNKDLDFDNNTNMDLEDEEPMGEKAPQEPDEPKEQEVPEEPAEELPSNESSLDFDEESYLAEYVMYTIDNVLQQESLMEYVRKDILREADEPNVTGYNTDDATVIEKIIITLQNIFTKFLNLFQTKTSQRAEFIKKNAEIIKSCDLNLGSGFKVTIYKNTDKLSKLVAEPLVYDTMKAYLVSESAFMKQYYPDFTGEMNKNDKTSVKESIKLTIIPDAENKETVNTVGQITNMINFCVDFGNNFNAIQKSVKDVKNASVMAKSIAKNIKQQQNVKNAQQQNAANATQQTTANTNNNQQQAATPAQPTAQNASFAYSTHYDYFNEKTDLPNAADGVKKTDGETNDPLKQVRTYFKVTTNVVCCRMTISQTIFNDYFAILNGALKLNGKDYYKGKKEPTTTNNQNNTNTNQQQAAAPAQGQQQQQQTPPAK